MAVILVVDNRESDRDALVTLLRQAGHRTLEAGNPSTALRTIRAETPELVFTDIVMPDMDGYQFVRNLRTDPAIEQPRVVFCTQTYLAEPAQELAKACGVSRVITKPADPELILEVLTEVLQADVDPPVAPPDDFDRTHLRLVSRTLLDQIEELEAANRDRSRLVADLVRAQEAERARIAADVHDDSIQMMAAVALRLEMLRDDLADPAEQAAVDAVAVKVRGAVVRLRRLIFDLSPRGVESGGLAAGIEAYLREVGLEAGFEWDLVGETSADLPDEVQTILYRIAQEATRNAQKHANATCVRVALGRRDGGTVMRIADNGVGFAGETAEHHRPGHVGLPSMRERVDLAGGTFRLDSAPGAGCTIEVWIPDVATEAAA
jgi:signal transduction histidine kinase